MLLGGKFKIKENRTEQNYLNPVDGHREEDVLKCATVRAGLPCG